MHIYIYIYACRHVHRYYDMCIYIHAYTYIHICIYIYIYTYIHLSLSLCIYNYRERGKKREREREREIIYIHRRPRLRGVDVDALEELLHLGLVHLFFFVCLCVIDVASFCVLFVYVSSIVRFSVLLLLLICMFHLGLVHLRDELLQRQST